MIWSNESERRWCDIRIHEIIYTLERKSIKEGNPIIFELVSEEKTHSEPDEHYLELLKLIDYMITTEI